MALNRDAILRIVVAVHFVFSSLVLMVPWLPSAYELNQISIIVLGLWAIANRNGVIQVELLMAIEAFSIVLDIIAIGMYFQTNRAACRGNSDCYFHFSAAFAIILLICKPVMLLLLNLVRKDRLGGEESPTFGQWGTDTGHVPGYQPIDEQTASGIPKP